VERLVFTSTLTTIGFPADGGPATVVELYHDEQGQESGVRATLVVER